MSCFTTRWNVQGSFGPSLGSWALRLTFQTTPQAEPAPYPGAEHPELVEQDQHFLASFCRPHAG